MPFIDPRELGQDPNQTIQDTTANAPQYYFRVGDGVDIKNVNPDLLNGLNSMAKDYLAATGKPLELVSGFRSNEHQAKLRADYEASGMKGAPVAVPGGSHHNYGNAVDISKMDANWISKNWKPERLDKYGLENGSVWRNPENWHFQVKGSIWNTAKEWAKQAGRDVQGIANTVTNTIGNVLGGGAGMVGASHGIDNVTSPEFQAGAEKAGRSFAQGAKETLSFGLLPADQSSDLDPISTKAGSVLAMYPGFRAVEALGSSLLGGGLLSELFAPSAAHSSLMSLLGYGSLEGLGSTIGRGEGMDKLVYNMSEGATNAALFAPLAPLSEFAGLKLGDLAATKAAKNIPTPPTYGGEFSRALDVPPTVRAQNITRNLEMAKRPTADLDMASLETPITRRMSPFNAPTNIAPEAVPVPTPAPTAAPEWGQFFPGTQPPFISGESHPLTSPRRIQVEPQPIRVGPEGEVILPGQEPGLPQVLQEPRLPFLSQPGEVPSPLPQITPDAIIPPSLDLGGTPTQDLGVFTPDIVTNQVIPSAKAAGKTGKRVRAGKNAPPPENGQPPEIITDKTSTPEVTSASAKLHELDSQIADMEARGQANSLDYTLANMERAVVLEQGKAALEPHTWDFNDSNPQPPESFEGGLWREGQPVQPKSPKAPPSSGGAEAVPEPQAKPQAETEFPKVGDRVVYTKGNGTTVEGNVVAIKPGDYGGDPLYVIKDNYGTVVGSTRNAADLSPVVSEAEGVFTPDIVSQEFRQAQALNGQTMADRLRSAGATSATKTQRSPAPAPPVDIKPSTVKPAGEMSVPTRIAVRDRGNGILDEFIVVPPEKAKGEYQLLHNIIKDEEIVNTGVIERGRSLDDIRARAAANPGVQLADSVYEPLARVETVHTKEAAQLRDTLEKMTFGEDAVDPTKTVKVRRRPKSEIIEDQGFTPDEEDAVTKVERIFSQNKAKAQEQKVWDGWKNWYYRQKEKWVDFSASAKRMLKDAGEAGKNAEMYHDLSSGSDMKAERAIEAANKEVFNDLSPADLDIMNGVARARRIMAISKYKPDHVHTGGLTAQECKLWLESLPADVRHRMMLKTDLLDQHFVKLLDALKADNMITDASYKALLTKADFYLPSKYLDFIDGPSYSLDVGGRTISVNGAGLQPLKGGSVGALEMDSRLLFGEYARRTYARIFRNRANRELLNIADEMPEMGIARRLGAKESGAPQETVIHAVDNDGNPVRMAVPNEFASGWILSSPQLSQMTAKTFKTLSGTQLIKALATGYNPAFAMANLPRDIAHIFFTTQEYSSNPVRFAWQMANDLRKTWKDAFFKTGSFLDYVDEGGGMSFLTHQGHHSKIVEALDKVPGVHYLKDAAGWMGETSEVWTRLALRNRALLNGKNAHEATWAARNYMDFYQGGGVSKALDNLIPYFGASVQGARGIGRAFIDHPGLMTWKMASIGTLSSGLFLYNHLCNSKVMSETSPEVQKNYWIFPLPEELSYQDEVGNTRRLLMTIPKDQFSRVVSTVFETALAKFLDIKTYDTSNFGKAMLDFAPIIQGQNLPPTVKAFFGYVGNYDIWRQQSIWKGANVKPSEEYYTARMGRDPTHPLLNIWGGLSGASPERTKYALEQLFTGTNPFLIAPMELFRAGMGGLNNADRKIVFSELLSRTPVLSRFIRTTSPYTAYGEQTAQYAQDANTKSVMQRRGLDDLSEIYYRDPSPENRRIIKDYIREQEPEDRQHLMQRFKINKQVFDYPDRDWWLHTYSLPAEAKAQAFMDKYNSLAGDEGAQHDLMRRAKKLEGYAGGNFMINLRKLMRGRNNGEASGG